MTVQFSEEAMVAIAAENQDLREQLKALQLTNEALRISADAESRRADQHKDRADGLREKCVDYAQRITELMTGFALSHDGLKGIVLRFGERIAAVEGHVDRHAQFLQVLSIDAEGRGLAMPRTEIEQDRSGPDAAAPSAEPGVEAAGAACAPSVASPAHTTGEHQ